MDDDTGYWVTRYALHRASRVFGKTVSVRIYRYPPKLMQEACGQPAMSCFKGAIILAADADDYLWCTEILHEMGHWNEWKEGRPFDYAHVDPYYATTVFSECEPVR